MYSNYRSHASTPRHRWIPRNQLHRMAIVFSAKKKNPYIDVTFNRTYCAPPLVVKRPSPGYCLMEGIAPSLEEVWGVVQRPWIRPRVALGYASLKRRGLATMISLTF